MRKLVYAVVLLVSCAGILAGPAAAQQLKGTLKKIADTKTIRLGYLRDSVPFSYVDQNGEPSGYSIDLCKRVAAGIQKQVDFSLMTWVDGGAFLVKAGQPSRGLPDLAGKKIAVVAGTTTEPALREALKKGYISAEVVTVSKHIDGLEALRKGEVDAYASDQVVLIGLATAVRDQMQLKLSEQQFSYEPYGLVLRRDDADFKQAVNTVLARLYRSGEIVQVYKRWFSGLGDPAPALIIMFGLNGLPE
jgi:ABC-type amino acid transport substrate-binding protein